MNTIQTKLLVYVILISIVPIAFLGSFYYGLSVENTNNKVNQASLETFNQLDKNILIKTNRIQNALELIFSNKRVHEILRNTDFRLADSTAFSAVRELDNIFSQFFLSVEELEGVILFSTKGGAYTYKCYPDEADTVDFTMKYGKADETPGKITWLGSFENPTLLNGEETVLLVGSTLRDTTYVKDQKFLATVYLLLKNDYFGDDYASADGVSTMIYDDKGKMIMSNGTCTLDNLWTNSLEIGRKIFAESGGNFKARIDDESYMLTFYTSPQTDWKYVRAVEYKEYISELRQIQYVTMAGIILLFAVIFLVNYFVIKKITSPIREVVHAMHEVGSQNFHVSLDINSNDEFGMISTGFNSMVEKINELFTRVVAEERKRKEADIMALQYQMTPHFLYNTLSSIRLNALMKGETETGAMLLIMGRFLRSTINNAGKMVRICDEMNNIADYISLYQIRYENRLSVTCHAEESVLECEIPAMMIQPVVENAIIHGLNPILDDSGSAQLCVTVKDCGEKVCISIRDNGIGIAPEKLKTLFYKTEETGKKERLHIGIVNIRDRIYDLFGEAYGITVVSEPHVFTQVDIMLPKRFNDEA